jgi:hypothetical protein
MSLLISNLETGERFPVQIPTGVAPVVLDANTALALHGEFNPPTNGKPS